MDICLRFICVCLMLCRHRPYHGSISRQRSSTKRLQIKAHKPGTREAMDYLKHCVQKNHLPSHRRKTNIKQIFCILQEILLGVTKSRRMIWTGYGTHKGKRGDCT